MTRREVNELLRSGSLFAPRTPLKRGEFLKTTTPPFGTPANSYQVQEGHILYTDAKFHGKVVGRIKDELVLDFSIFGQGQEKKVRVSPGAMSYSQLNAPTLNHAHKYEG